MEFSGLLTYGIFTLTFIGIYAVLALGLNVQWGMTGLFNIGIGRILCGWRLYQCNPDHGNQ